MVHIESLAGSKLFTFISIEKQTCSIFLLKESLAPKSLLYCAELFSTAYKPVKCMKKKFNCATSCTYRLKYNCLCIFSNNHQI